MGGRVAGVVALVLAAASLVLGILNRFMHFMGLRTRWLLLIFVVLLIIGVLLLIVSRPRSAPQASK